eukprot:jgi/Ulvmu1/11191/UM072_0027.1
MPPCTTSRPHRSPPRASNASACRGCEIRRSAAVIARDKLTRRQVFSIGSLPALLAPRPAEAVVTLTDKDGRSIEAYELAFKLNIVALVSSVGDQEILDFKKGCSKYCGLKLGFRSTIKDIYTELLDAPPPVYTDDNGRAVRLPSKFNAAKADLVMLGDQWMQSAITAGALRPFHSPQSHRFFEMMAPCWKEVFTRNSAGLLDSHGDLYGVPARWGAMVIVYRPAEFQQFGLKPIQDWIDLLQPKLSGKVAFVNSPRDFIGAAAKSLGLPYNVTPDDLRAAGVSEAQLTERARALHGQCRTFSDTDTLAALKGRDVWAAVCPCDSAALVAARSTRLAQVVPASGTGLFADVWVQPRRAGEPSTSPIIPLWVERGLYPGRDASQLGLREGFMPHTLKQVASHSTAARSRQLAPLPEGQVLESMSEVDPELLRRSEFVEPAGDAAQALYRRLLAALDMPRVSG